MLPGISIKKVASKTDLEEIKDLFREYFAWVRDDLHFDLSYQGIDKELKALPGEYASPQGCLLLVRSGDEPAGCIALQPHTSQICELKRMYVRPGFRGQGIGKMLCSDIIQTAKQTGYSLMRLDTEVTLNIAQRIYTEFGFHPAVPYYDAPESARERTIFMELELG